MSGELITCGNNWIIIDKLDNVSDLEEMERKLLFYQRYGVEEYYLYDPDSHNFQGWWRQEGLLSSIPEIKGWVSPRLSIRFDLREDGLEIYSFRGATIQNILQFQKEYIETSKCSQRS